MDLMMPPTLNDSRLSSFVATVPWVVMAGKAGPVVASCTRTGVRCWGASWEWEEEPAGPTASAPAASSFRLGTFKWLSLVRPRARTFASRPGVERQDSRRGRIVELRLTREQVEASYIQVELGAGE